MKQRIYLILGLLVFGFMGCQKDDHTNSFDSINLKSDVINYIKSDPFLVKFLNAETLVQTKLENRSDEEVLEKIKIQLATEDKKTRVLKKINKDFGNILWQKYSKYESTDSKNISIFLPLKHENQEYLSAVIMVGIENTSLSFELYHRNQIKQLISKSKGKELSQNLPALVLYFLSSDYSICHGINIDYIDWLNNYEKNKLHELETRGYYLQVCQDVCIEYARSQSTNWYQTGVNSWYSSPSGGTCIRTQLICNSVYISQDPSNCWACYTAPPPPPSNNTGVTGTGSGAGDYDLSRNAHNSLLASNPDYSSLNSSFKDASPFLWPILKEVAVEIAFLVIKKQIGSTVSLPNDVIEGIKGISQGDLLQIIESAVNIAKKSFPALKVADAIYDAGNLASKARKIVGQVVAMFESLGSSICGKLWDGMKRNVNVLDMDISGGPLGMKIVGKSIEDLWRHIQEAFGNPMIFTESPPNIGTYFEIGNIRLTWYPIDKSFGTPAISIGFGNSPIYKFRS